MPGRKRCLEGHRAVNQVDGPKPYWKRKRIVEEREGDDQVIGRTMKTCLVELIRLAMVQPQMRVGMVGHQCMDSYFRRDRQRK